MPTARTSKADSLTALFDTMRETLSRHAPPFKLKTGMVRNKRDLHLMAPKLVAIPGKYGGKPVEKAMAAIIEQKGYVGFYFSTTNADPALKKKISALLKTLKGKSCFHLTRWDEALLEEVESTLQAGTKFYKAKGWL